VKKPDYQWECFINKKKPDRNISSWKCRFGAEVVSRNSKGSAEKVRVSVIAPDSKSEIFLVGEFNEWGKNDKEKLRLQNDSSGIAWVETDKLKHKDTYKLVCDGVFLQDPAGHYFDDIGNTVFWDFEDPSAYRQNKGFVNTINRSTVILQSDLPGLIVHWADRSKGICGRDLHEKNFYAFIRDSGIVEHIKDLGFNTVQFLPFAQSIDGSNWKYRYLVPFQFAVQKNWGTPDEFASMVDEFHRHGIAVIGDFVLGHLPYKDYRIFGKDCDNNGIHSWKKADGEFLYLKEPTYWGTIRIDFDNPLVREFFTSSCLHFMKRYRIDGFRIDNVDGIIRYGASGDGEERPNGRTFLRELHQEIYRYNHNALIHLEAHYFHGDNAKMLVAPFDEDKRALGATAYNSSRLTYFFHTDFMLKDAKEITPWKIKHIAEEKEWGKSNSTVADFHNHDAAAGLMEQRCTGSYAYDAMAGKQPHNHMHALGKIKVMEGIISFCCEGRTLDLAQTFLLQMGTFEHNSSIHWELAFLQVSKNSLEFKKAVNKLMKDPAFWPLFAKNRAFLNIDDKSKILVVERSAEYKGKKSKYVILINMSSWVQYNYKVGVRGTEDYEVVLNSDLFEFSGFGMTAYPKVLRNQPSSSFELLSREVELSKVAPYAVVVLKAIERKE